ncbi:PREDICTED: cytochrome P450 CYP736A12-like [Nicotiana attenuata]|uniref:Cytochrome p450 cyp736a12 n=1 Tax=Nicotiana attenuata TaxID=49451 RepID=A0A1J6KD66_NICAT|nr:PREDICTED: cytochrome P450 CYP736A12-like [Nicotiana attenuata]OIT20763.1 cytochrome p450 cyp736a12 [Nicotiana attenuata]
MFSIYIAFLSIFIGFLLYFIQLRWKAAPENVRRKLPPGPRGLPIIGNLHMLGTLPHRTLYDLSKKYGPIMFLKLGNVPTVVVSSPETAELILKTHDAVFASRPKLKAVEYVSDGAKGLAFAPYGPQWRNARKFCIQELLTAEKIESFAGMRKEEIGVLVRRLKVAADGGEVVELGEKIGDLIANMTYRMLFGDIGNSDRFDLKSIVQEMVRLAGAFNIADYVPFLEPFDIQGLNKQLKETGKAVQKVFDTIINEHEQDARNGTHKGSKVLVDVMLSHQNCPKSYSIDRATMKAILSDMIVGAIDTSHTWIEWAFAEIVKHSRVMNKLQEELISVVGLDRMVEEQDLPKLEYLELVLKETFRLHPVATLLVPRESMEDVVINGYYIPRRSRVMINCWALGHDPKIWSDNVEEFVPERGLLARTDVRGHDFILLPFGYGRRSCPGMNLGLITVKLIVAQLVHCFSWDLPEGMLHGDLDMTEKFGLAAPRAQNLLVIPTYRLHS